VFAGCQGLFDVGRLGGDGEGDDDGVDVVAGEQVGEGLFAVVRVEVWVWEGGWDTFG
jgi:hypothetical protein